MTGNYMPSPCVDTQCLFSPILCEIIVDQRKQMTKQSYDDMNEEVFLLLLILMRSSYIYLCNLIFTYNYSTYGKDSALEQIQPQSGQFL